MLTIEESFNLMAKSQEALNRLKSIRYLEENNKLKAPTPNYAKLLLEEFDEDSLRDKILRDKSYYDVLMYKLTTEQQEVFKPALESLLETVGEIYKHLNIKPKIYASNRLPDINESEEIMHQSASRIINEFISRNYYKLTTENRIKIYEQQVNELSKSLIIESNIELDEAIEFSTKVVVLQQLIENINFPLVIKSEIESSLTSEQYGELFEQEELVKLWETFKDRSYKFAKVISATI